MGIEWRKDVAMIMDEGEDKVEDREMEGEEEEERWHEGNYRW